jgi:hypothetical protein
MDVEIRIVEQVGQLVGISFEADMIEFNVIAGVADKN